MLGLSSTELATVKALPICLLIAASLIFLLESLWALQGHPRLVCAAPQNSVDGDKSGFVNQVCSATSTRKYRKDLGLNGRSTEVDLTSEIEKPYLGTAAAPLHLLVTALFLTIPLLIGDTVLRTADSGLVRKASDNGRAPNESIAQTILRFINRLVYIGMYITALYRMQSFMISELNMQPLTNAAGLLKGDTKSLTLDSRHVIAMCDFPYQYPGRISIKKLPCVVLYGPQIKLAIVFEMIAWMSITLILVWITFGTLQCLVILLLTFVCQNASNAMEPSTSEGREGHTNLPRQEPNTNQTAQENVEEA